MHTLRVPTPRRESPRPEGRSVSPLKNKPWRSSTALHFVQIIFWLLLTITAAHFAPFIFESFRHGADGELMAAFFDIAILCFLSFLTFYLSVSTPFPPFVIAIVFGMAAKPFFEPIVSNHIILPLLVSLGATLILFQGGLETPFKNFRRLFWKIFMLAFPGVLVTGLLLSGTVSVVGSAFGLAIPALVAVLLGVVLASTDPAAVIPLLRGLEFKKRDIKDIIVSESAVNDVVGALLSLVLISLAATGQPFETIIGSYEHLFGYDAAIVLLKQIIFGLVFGVLGYVLLTFFVRHKNGHDKEHGADAAFFIFVPIITFAGALALGGSGYLAAFVAGLVFYMVEHLKSTERFFNDVIDGFAKPIIFLLLGALVDVQQLINFAGIGLAVAFLFMFIVRPLMVFLTIGPFALFGKDRFTLSELLFISWVRETGAIPAVLLITIVSLGLPGTEAIVPIGMWVILATLVVQPPVTPWLAHKLNLSQPE